MPHIPSRTSDKQQLSNTQLAIHFLKVRFRLQALGVKFSRKTPPALYSIFSYIAVIQARRNPNLSWALWKWHCCETRNYYKFYLKIGVLFQVFMVGRKMMGRVSSVLKAIWKLYLCMP